MLFQVHPIMRCRADGADGYPGSVVYELFNDGLCTVTTSHVSAGTATYSVASVTGVRVVPVRDAFGIKMLGILGMYFGLHYAACGAVCSAGGSTDTSRDMLGLGVLGLVLGLGLVVWAINGKPTRFVVMLNIAGNDIGLAQYAALQPAKEAAAAVLSATERLRVAP